MNSKNKMIDYAKELERLDEIMKDSEHLLIIVHNNPDPDALASAMALKYLIEKRNEKQVSITYGGNIGRAENQTMVRKLKIPLKQIGKIHFDKYDRIALVDTQPGFGNNSLPDGVTCQIIIDHHPPQQNLKNDLVIIEPDIGVTATIIVDLLKESKITIPADIATALSYAISSETQNLGREACRRDIEAYLHVYIRSSIRKLAEIIFPKLPNSYYVTLEKTLKNTLYYQNLICAHLGPIPAAEFVGEMADFLLRHDRIGWTLCTGFFKGRLFLAVRTSNPKNNAGKLVKNLVKDKEKVGGHDMIAGGYIPLESSKAELRKDLEQQLTENFAKQMGYDKDIEWKNLIDNQQNKKKNRTGNDNGK